MRLFAGDPERAAALAHSMLVDQARHRTVTFRPDPDPGPGIRRLEGCPGYMRGYRYGIG